MQNRKKIKDIRKKILLILTALSFSLFSFAEDLPPPSSSHMKHPWSFKTFGLIPIQNRGRIKPLDSFAREMVLFETGSQNYKNWNALDLLLSWITFPQVWEKVPFIQVSQEALRKQLGLEKKRNFYSPKELYENQRLGEIASQMQNKTQKQDQDVKTVLDRIGLFHSISSGEAWSLIPNPFPKSWENLSLINSEKNTLSNAIGNHFLKVLKAYLSGDAKNFEASSFLLKKEIEGGIANYDAFLKNRIFAEYLYQRFQPFFLAWVLYLFAALTWMAPKKLSLIGFFLTGSAFLSQAFGIALRCYIAGRPPVTNMYESLIWVSFGVIVFALLLYFLQNKTKRHPFILGTGCILALLGLVAADAAPIVLDPSLHPLVPVLRSNYWLTIHVLTITLGYAAFALTFGIANFTLFEFIRQKGIPQKNLKMLQLNQITYRAMQFGVVLIAAGTILGGIWADYSWGRFWGWDPKEVWALITLLCYLMILHGRYAGWVGPFGFAIGSALSFLSVVMAWYGVNFILGVGLHTYGFSTGGTPWVLGFVIAELLYLSWMVGVYYKPRLFLWR